MSQWTWRQSVAEEVLKFVTVHRSLIFEMKDFFQASENVFRERFPHNRHVRQIVRKSLQELRDMGFLSFLGAGKYQVDPGFPELEFESAHAEEAGLEIPQMRTVVRRIRLRDTLLTADMKRRYKNICQVCREALKLVGQTYSEGHHLKPLGSPHFGPDTEGNIIVVCPNHHIMFDRGALCIDPASLIVRHLGGAMRPCPLLVEPWHRLSSRCLDYQFRRLVPA
jgi:hypothetical protein